MKYLVIFGALALAACSDANTAEEPVVAETAAAPAVATAAPVALMAADGMPADGTYEITDDDGSITTQVVRADGTFTATEDDGSETTGTWTIKEPDLWCQTETGETEEECYHEKIENGVWTSVDAEDATDTSTIVRK